MHLQLCSVLINNNKTLFYCLFYRKSLITKFNKYDHIIKTNLIKVNTECKQKSNLKI